MCSRFEQKVRATEVAKRFGLSDPPPLINAPEIRPTDQALIITTNGTAHLSAWGFEIPWSNQPMINARSETLTEKPTFRDLLEHRCIIPASSYYEWRKDGTNKHKNKISVESLENFSMAGLFDGNRFTVITCEPSIEIAHIHSRMPVILAPEAERDWLTLEFSFSDVRKYLHPYESHPLRATEDRPPQSKQRDLFD